jgi:hypothetical protein
MARSRHRTTEDMGTHEEQAKLICPEGYQTCKPIQQLETKQSMGAT